MIAEESCLLKRGVQLNLFRPSHRQSFNMPREHNIKPDMSGEKPFYEMPDPAGRGWTKNNSSVRQCLWRTLSEACKSYHESINQSLNAVQFGSFKARACRIKHEVSAILNFVVISDSTLCEQSNLTNYNVHNDVQVDVISIT